MLRKYNLPLYSKEKHHAVNDNRIGYYCSRSCTVAHQQIHPDGWYRKENPERRSHHRTCNLVAKSVRSLGLPFQSTRIG